MHFAGLSAFSLGLGPLLGLFIGPFLCDASYVGCYIDADLSNPIVRSVQAVATNSTVQCSASCEALKREFFALSQGKFCHCLGSLGGMIAAAGNCTIICPGNLECGGASLKDHSVYNHSNLKEEIKSLAFSLPVPTDIYSPVTVEVSANGDWFIDWGDGTIHEMWGANATSANHSYYLSGQFRITATLDDIRNNSAPCTLETVEVGVGYNFSFQVVNEFSETGPTKSSILPVSRYRHAGHRLPDSAGTIMTLAEMGEIIVLANSRSFNPGEIVISLRGSAFVDTANYPPGVTSGLQFYQIERFCESGTYCPLLDACVSSYSSPSSVSLCHQSDSCNSSCGGTVTSAKWTSSFIFMTSFTEQTGPFWVYLPNAVTWQVSPKEGSFIAFSCKDLAPNYACPQLYKANIGPLENHEGNYLFNLSTGSLIPLRLRHSISLTIEEATSYKYFDPLECSVPNPVPKSSIALPYSAATEQYIYQSFNLTLSLQVAVGSYAYNVNETITNYTCQEPISVKAKYTEITLAYSGQTVPISLLFYNGSSIFTVVDSGDGVTPLLYDYLDITPNSVYEYTLNLSFAKPGDFNVTGISSNPFGSQSFWTLVHLIPGVTKNWTLQVCNPCANIPNGLSIKAILSTYLFPPWNATVLFTIQKSDASDSPVILLQQSFDFHTWGNPSFSGPLEINITRTIQKTGFYNITMTISNEVSNESFSKGVEIVFPLTAELFYNKSGEIVEALGPNKTTLIAYATSYFVLKNLVGNPIHWRVIINEAEVVTSSSNNFTYAFQKEGFYNLTFGFYDLTNQWIDLEPIKIEVAIIKTIMKPLGLILTDDNQIVLPGAVKEVIADCTSVTLLNCIIVDFGDSSTIENYGYDPKCIDNYPGSLFKLTNTSQPISLSHIYAKEGTYTVKVMCFDDNNSFLNFITVVVADIPCTMPQVQIKGEVKDLKLPPSISRSRQVAIQANVDYECNQTYSIERFWNVSKVDENSGKVLADVSIKDRLTSWNYTKLVMPGNFLEYGVYKCVFEFIIHLPPQYKLHRSDFCYVKIVQSQLKLIMIEGASSERSAGYGQLLDLNPGLLSADPDFPLEKGENISFTWWCRQVAPNFGVLPQTSEGDYEIINLQDIPQPLTSVNLKGGGCFGVGDGTLSHPYKSILLNTASFVHSNATYQLILKGKKDTRNAFVSLIINTYNSPPPGVIINCSSAICIPATQGLIFNPSKRLPFSGRCSVDCQTNVTYRWTIETRPERLPARLQTPCELYATSDPFCESALLSTMNGTEFVLSPSFFNINPEDSFAVRLTVTNSMGKSGYSENIIVRNKPPVDGHCVMNKTVGLALITEFEVNCFNWVDPEMMGIQSYTYFTTSANLQKTSFASVVESSLQMVFPISNFTLYVEISDILMGVTQYVVSNVTALMPSEKEFTDYNVNAKMSFLSNSGKQTDLYMFLGALSSIRDSALWDAMDSRTLENMTKSEIDQRLMPLCKMNKDQSSAMMGMINFASTKDINVGANIVQKLLATSSQHEMGVLTLDTSTKDNALKLLGFMTATIPTLDDATFPYDLQEFISKSLDSLSYILSDIPKILEMGKLNLVAPTDQMEAVNWDYDVDIGNDINMEIPISDDMKVLHNIMDTTLFKSKKQIEDIYNILDLMEKQVLGLCYPGEMLNVKGEYGSSAVIVKINEIELQNGFQIVVSGMENASSNVLFPRKFCPSKYVLTHTDCRNLIGFRVVLWPTITHLYAESSKLLSTYSYVLDIKVTVANQLSSVKDEKPIIFDIPLKRSSNLSDPLFVNVSKALNPHLPFVYHSFNVSNQGVDYTIEITPQTSLPNGLIFLIDYERMPTYNQYMKIVSIRNFSTNENMLHTFLVRSEAVNKTGRCFIAVGVLKNAKEMGSLKQFQPDDFDKNFKSNYYFRIVVAGCYYFNQELGEWQNDNLLLVKATQQKVTCATSHLTSFSAKFEVVPNIIAFNFVFANAGFYDNLTIYVALILFTSLYILLMVWGHYMDRCDAERRGVIPLPDNKLCDKYLYEITFFTGPDKEASTDSNIKFLVSGDYGETEIRHLPAANNCLYRRFGVDSFVVAVPNPLGHINLLRIFHDNSGEPPLNSWQLQMVVLRNLQISEKFVFYTNSWLDLSREDGVIDKIFTSSDDNENEFSQNMYILSNRTVNQDNIYLSMFMRPPGSRFGRKERVTVCAVFVYLLMLLSAIWYNGANETARNGYFDFGLLTMSSEQLLVAIFNLCISYPVASLLILVFKRARPRVMKRCRALDAIERQRRLQCEKTGIQSNEAEKLSKLETKKNQECKPKEKSPVRCFPWWTRYLAWFLSLVCICFSIFFVWTYGIMWGETKTAKWLSTFLTAFVFSILVVHLIMTLLFSLIFYSICKTDFSIEDVDCDEELPTLKEDESWSYKESTDVSIRKKVFRIEGVDVTNPNVAALRLRLRKERKIKYVIKGLFIYSVFLAVLFILVSGRTDYSSFLLQNHLRTSFIKEGHLEYDFAELVKNTDDWWRWAKNVVLQEMRAQKLYNDDPPYGLRGYLNDQANRIMGYAIVRQVRNRRYNCGVTYPMNSIIDSCSGVRGPTNEETKDFCAGWAVNETFPGSCNWNEFKYKTAEELGTFPQIGKLGMYSGGGYVFRLSGPQEELLKRMDDLQRNFWIDKNTKAVSLEFSLYNANVNLFCTCLIMAEFNDGGGILPKWRFEPLRLINEGTFGFIVFLSQIFFVVATGIATLRELYEIQKQKLKYFSSYWNILEICILSASYVSIGLYCYRAALTQKALSIFKTTNGNGYVRIDSAAFIDQYFLNFVGFIVFFSTIKIIKLLQFNKRMNILGFTIKRSWDELKIFLIAFFVVFFAFSCMFYHMFTGAIENFAQIVSAIEYSFQMMLGKFDFEEMTKINSLAPILFFVFSVANSMILLNVMITIILMGFKEATTGLSTMQNRLNLIDYVWTSFKQFIRKERLPKLHVKPVYADKGDEPLFQSNEKPHEQFPNKVGQLLQYISDVYLDGRLVDENQHSSQFWSDGKISFFKGKLNDKDKKNRKIFNSDT